MLRPLLLLFFLFNFCSLKGQGPAAGFDTIFHQVDSNSLYLYHFDHPDFKDVCFYGFQLELHSPLTYSNIERQFTMGGYISHDLPLLNWDIVLFGKWKKKRYLAWEWDTENGLNFVRETEKKIYWGNPFTGTVLSGMDTISHFSVYTNPAKQAIFSGIWETAKSYQYHAGRSFFKEALKSIKNLGITGTIDSIPFKIIYIQPVKMALIMKEEQLNAVFVTADLYSLKEASAFGRPFPKTFLLIKPGHNWDDEAEMIRLSMLTMFIADAVRPENIN